MTPNDSPRERTFVPRILPWLLAAVALIVYLLTLNHWLSFLSLVQNIRLAGWTLYPELNSPAFYLITFPLRWLSPKWIPLALNLISVACASLTVYQLARSVVLLPHDRTHEQRLREHSEFSTLSIPLAWIPPVLAVAACAFQITFWEHATNGTSEMFDLLLFAYVIRSLLEYRLDGREARLLRAAFAFAVGMTGNFAMVGFFPLFVAAVVWIRGASFFHLNFLARMALCGLAGLSLYLLLPILAGFQAIEPVGFWTALKANLGMQKNVLMLFPKKTAFLLSLTSLLPVFVICIRWSSYFGDTSKMGAALAKTMFNVVHALFLLACLWTAFDPQFSPRHKGLGIPFLTFYYLGALSIGYFSGYLLLVLRKRVSRSRTESTAVDLGNMLAPALILALLIIVTAGLIYKNLPAIRALNGPALSRFAAAHAEGLPKSGAVLSDDLRRLLIVRSWLARDGRDKDFIFLDTQSLKSPAYHRYLHANYPEKWEAPPDDYPFPTFQAQFLLSRIVTLAKDTDICYLHPSFGYYFEVFRPEPHGLTFWLKRYDAKTLVPPSPTPEIIAENETFWSKMSDESLNSLASDISPDPSTENPLPWRLFDKLGIKREASAQDSLLGDYYSRSLDYWGVEMQKAGQFDKAAGHFVLAEKLNPDNVVASVNLEANKNLQAGITTPVTLTKSMEEMLGKYRSWEQVINANGPYDEVSLSYAQAWIFMQNQLYRQAAQNFHRVLQLTPDHFPSLLSLAQISLIANLPDDALSLINETRTNTERFTLTTTNLADITAVEASAWYVKNEPQKASEILEAAVKKKPDDTHLLANVVNVYMRRGDLTNALATVEHWIKVDPQNPVPFVNKAYIYMSLKDYDAAISTLNTALAVDPQNEAATLNRAIAYLTTKRLDEAEKDYKVLEELHPNQFQIQYGLGEIAWQRQDTNDAIQHYERYLTNAPSMSAEAKLVTQRLSQLKGEKTE